MAKIKCEGCGHESDTAHVDGYSFGDTLLEGVLFIISWASDKPKALGVTESCKKYFSGLAQKKWLKACEEYCADNDVFACEKCGEDVYP